MSRRALLLFGLLALGSFAAQGAWAAAPERGAALFASSGCEHCHGVNGLGGSETGPDLKDVRKRLTPEAMSTQIRQGGHGMPAFGGILAPGDVDQLVAYLRTKRKAAKGGTAAVSNALRQ